MNEDILGYLLDALEPEQQERIEARIATDPQFRAEVERMRRLLLPLAADDHIEPPPNLADRTIARVREVVFSSREAEWAPWSRVGFLDVLVAASVVAVMVSLMIPAVATVRGMHSRLLCADQLRSIGVALAMYTEQDGRCFPFVAESGPLNNAGSFALMLKQRELVPSIETFRCPAAESTLVILPEPSGYLGRPPGSNDQREARRYMSGSYGYVLGYQEDGRHRGYQSGVDAQPLVSDRPPRLGEPFGPNSPNHAGVGQNVLFAGGNVRWMTTRMFANDDLFHNAGHSVGAGLGPRDTVIGVSEATPYPTVGL
jgi:hypothetical protein